MLKQRHLLPTVAGVKPWQRQPAEPLSLSCVWKSAVKQKEVRNFMRWTAFLLVGLLAALVVPALARQALAADEPTAISADKTPQVEKAPGARAGAAVAPRMRQRAMAQQRQRLADARVQALAKRFGLNEKQQQTIKGAARRLMQARRVARLRLSKVMRLAQARDGQETELTQALAEFRKAKANVDRVQQAVDRRLRRELKLSGRPRLEAALLSAGILDNGLGGPAVGPSRLPAGRRAVGAHRRAARGSALRPTD